jgi:choline dehydrogenase
MYDYVIVGAGSAGCVLANRLTEDPKITVLLLEAGGEDNKREVAVPAAFSKLFKTEVDWAFYTEAQHHLKDRKLYWPRGKMLGGSSSINAMIYIRGHRADYDGWRDLGNAGWGYDDVLPYFKKAQNQERGASEYHGVGGPLNVADQRSPNPISQAFVDAGVGMGWPRNADFNGASQEGVGLYQVTQKGGARNSAARGYLHPIRGKRPNLTVQTNAHATRVLFEGTRAVGVAYVQNGASQEARASREVILCGGAVNSPQLLLLSGVGPSDHLKDVGIEVVHHLPGVGHNLQDHLATGVGWYSTRPITLMGADKKIGNVLNFLLFHKGPFTSVIAESGGFLKTKPDLPAPDLQFHVAPAFFVDHGAGNPDAHGFTIGPTLIQPESRGHIGLHSRDPLAPPLIQPNYLAHHSDVDVLVEGLKLGRRLAQLEPLAQYRGAEFLPGEQVQTDEELEEFVREHTETLYHPAGTCKMGHDHMAVVDARLRVHGVQGLRVVDASIMPTVVRGNTNAPTIMIAEKAADLIKQDAAATVAAAEVKTTASD